MACSAQEVDEQATDHADAITDGAAVSRQVFPMVLPLLTGQGARGVCTATLVGDGVFLTSGHSPCGDPPGGIAVLQLEDRREVPAEIVKHPAFAPDPSKPWHENDRPDIAVGFFDPSHLELRSFTKASLCTSSEVGALVGDEILFPGHGCHDRRSSANVGLRYARSVVEDVSSTRTVALGMPGGGCPGDSGGPYLRFLPGGGVCQAAVHSGSFASEPRVVGVNVLQPAVASWLAQVANARSREICGLTKTCPGIVFDTMRDDDFASRQTTCSKGDGPSPIEWCVTTTRGSRNPHVLYALTQTRHMYEQGNTRTSPRWWSARPSIEARYAYPALMRRAWRAKGYDAPTVVSIVPKGTSYAEALAEVIPKVEATLAQTPASRMLLTSGTVKIEELLRIFDGKPADFFSASSIEVLLYGSDSVPRPEALPGALARQGKVHVALDRDGDGSVADGTKAWLSGLRSTGFDIEAESRPVEGLNALDAATYADDVASRLMAPYP